MSKTRTDLTGQVFNKLEFIKFEIFKNNHSYWNVKCYCGNIFITQATSVKNGTVKSCGCSRRLENGEASFNHLFATRKRNAVSSRNLKWDLNKEQFKILSKQNCYYCGVEPQQKHEGYSFYGEYIYNGIDRINNQIGYIIDNCVSCCKKCNFMKGTLCHTDFINQIKQICKNLNE